MVGDTEPFRWIFVQGGTTVKIFFVRRGQELEVAKALLKDAEGSILSRAKNATLESEHLRTEQQEEEVRFKQQLEEMEATHRDNMGRMNARVAVLGVEATELTGQAERVLQATNVLG